MTSATEHVCAKCGKQLDPVNWWTASVADRFGGQSYKLCKPCAESVNFAVQSVIAMEAKGDCTICKGWVDDGRGGTCVFTEDFWIPCCPYGKDDRQTRDYPLFGFC